jgi:hypothetical protein
MGDSAEALRIFEGVYHPMVHPARNPVFWKKMNRMATLLRWFKMSVLPNGSTPVPKTMN